MTLQECYKRLQGNYEDVHQRLMNDTLVEKFMLKFPADGTMAELRSAVEQQKHEESFRAVHTLKGVAGNLGFTRLQEAASRLTEQLRNNTELADPDLFSQVESSYEQVLEALAEYKKEKE